MSRTGQQNPDMEGPMDTPTTIIEGNSEERQITLEMGVTAYGSRPEGMGQAVAQDMFL